MSINYYSYQELRDAAMETRSDADIRALAEWLEQYGDRYFNGECWDIDDGYTLWPVWELVDQQDPEDPDSWEVTGYEIR